VIEHVEAIKEPVYDVSFAPAIGRSFAVLAVASQKGLRIVTFKPPTSTAPATEATKLEVKHYFGDQQ